METFDTIEFEHPHVWMDFTQTPQFVYLNSIKVWKPKRNTGLGTKQMIKALKRADDLCLPIRLTPDDNLGTPIDVLLRWYRKLGFENYDTTGTELVYFPKNYPEHLKALL